MKCPHIKLIIFTFLAVQAASVSLAWAKTFDLEQPTGYNIRFDGSAAGDEITKEGTLLVGDVNGDGVNDLVIGSQDADGSVDGDDKGAVWVIFSTTLDDVDITDAGVRQDLRAEIQSYNVKITGSAADDQITADGALAIGDVNGDGKSDLILGSKSHSTNKGAVWVIFSDELAAVGQNKSVELSLASSDNYSLKILGAANNDQLSDGGVIHTGDVNEDGLGDLVIGTPQPLSDRGTVYVLFSSLVQSLTSGAATGVNVQLNAAANFNLRYYGENANDRISRDNAVAIGDVNGDGLNDLVIGSKDKSSDRGAAWIIFSDKMAAVGATTGNEFEIDDANVFNLRLNGVSNEDSLTEDGAVWIADVNGDGFSDLLLGSQDRNTLRGALYVLFSNQVNALSSAAGETEDLVGANVNAIVAPATGSAGHLTAQRALAVGDVNRDGVKDLVVGAPLASNGETNSGSVYVLFSTRFSALGATTNNTLNISSAANYDVRFDGPHANSFLSRAHDVEAGGEPDYKPSQAMIRIADLTQDGKGDLLIGSPFVTGASGVDEGAVWLIFSDRIADLTAGQAQGVAADINRGDAHSVRIVAGNDNTSLGLQGAIALGDANHDGRTDLFLGAQNKGTGNEGAVWAILADFMSTGVDVRVLPTTVKAGDLVTVEAAITNTTSERLTELQGFKVEVQLPPGLQYQTGSGRAAGDGIQESATANFVRLTGFEPMDPGQSITMTFSARVGTNLEPGDHEVKVYARFNPVISNVGQGRFTVKPDPVFQVGTLIGKVFWDQNANGYQDEGEPGIPNAQLATEQGYVITTDEYGRYHIPDFFSGRHKVKIDEMSLPAGSRLTTPVSQIVNQTDAMLTKVNFGVELPADAAAAFGGTRSDDMEILVRQDEAAPAKRLGLAFHHIRREDNSTRVFQENGNFLLSEGGRSLVLPIRPDTNYADFADSWKFEILKVTDAAKAMAVHKALEAENLRPTTPAVPAVASLPDIRTLPSYREIPKSEMMGDNIRNGERAKEGSFAGLLFGGAKTVQAAENYSGAVRGPVDASGNSRPLPTGSSALSPSLPFLPPLVQPSKDGKLPPLPNPPTTYSGYELPVLPGVSPLPPLAAAPKGNFANSEAAVEGSIFKLIGTDGLSPSPAMNPAWTRDERIANYAQKLKEDRRYNPLFFDETLETLASLKGEGALPQQPFLWEWTDPLRADSGEINSYFVRLTVHDKEGRTDGVLYHLSPFATDRGYEWRLTRLVWIDTIPVKGSLVTVSGKTHPDKIVSLFDCQSVSGPQGDFSFQNILPEGDHKLPIKLYLDENAPVEVERSVRVRNNTLFVVGFGEAEMGGVDTKGNPYSLTGEMRDRAEEDVYYDGRLAYYLKGKLAGKYLVTASIDTEREKKRDLKRILEPEDYYATYGDRSLVTAEADDTRDPYYLLIEADKSYLKYGNFDTQLTDLEFLNFNRSLHGTKVHVESQTIEPDGKPNQEVTGFAAETDARAAHNEFRATDGLIYYLKHRGVLAGSEKIYSEERDPINGLATKRKMLVQGVDYTIDYSEGRVRLTNWLTAFTFDSMYATTDASLNGNLQYLVVDYEHDSGDLAENTTYGLRASKSYLENRLRLGGTYVSEQRATGNYSLGGVDGRVELPLETELAFEVGQSSMTSQDNFVSRDGGLSFDSVETDGSRGAGAASKFDIFSRPISGMDLHAYYRSVDRDFSSSAGLSQAGTEKTGLRVRQQLGVEETLSFLYDEQELLGGGNEASLLNSVSGVFGAAGAAADGSGGRESRSTIVQYQKRDGRWTRTIEYRGTTFDADSDHLLGASLDYAIDPLTTVGIEGQAGLVGEDNDRVALKARRTVAEGLDLVAKQSLGKRGNGTQIGLDNTPLSGSSYLMNRGLSPDAYRVEPGAETSVGFDRNFGANNTLGVLQGTAGSRTVQLTRRNDAQTLRLQQETTSSTNTQRLIEEREVNSNLTQYSQNAMESSSRTGERAVSRLEGTRAKILNGRGSLYSEDEYLQRGELAREGRRTGVAFRPTEKTQVDVNYQRYQDQSNRADGTDDETDTTDDSTGTDQTDNESHAGGVQFQYLDFGKLQAKNTWEARRQHLGGQDILQIYTDGAVEYRHSPEWTFSGRYEWGWTDSQVLNRDLARFTEVQTGAAYRPIFNDRLNLFGEFKYLDDEGTEEQTSADNLVWSRRFVYRGELIYDLTRSVSLVEKFALRDEDSLIAGTEAASNRTYLSAHRINWWATQTLGLNTEYRLLKYDGLDQLEQGFLVEGAWRAMDELSVAVGYNFSDLDSDMASDLNVETRGWYVRLFPDPSPRLEKIVNEPGDSAKSVARDIQPSLRLAQ